MRVRLNRTTRSRSQPKFDRPTVTPLHHTLHPADPSALRGFAARRYNRPGFGLGGKSDFLPLGGLSGFSSVHVFRNSLANLCFGVWAVRVRRAFLSSYRPRRANSPDQRPRLFRTLNFPLLDGIVGQLHVLSGLVAALGRSKAMSMPSEQFDGL